MAKFSGRRYGRFNDLVERTRAQRQAEPEAEQGTETQGEQAAPLQYRWSITRDEGAIIHPTKWKVQVWAPDGTKLHDRRANYAASKLSAKLFIHIRIHKHMRKYRHQLRTERGGAIEGTYVPGTTGRRWLKFWVIATAIIVGGSVLVAFLSAVSNT